MIKFKNNLILLLVFTVFIPLITGYTQEKELQKVTFLPMWFPQPQFAGYYVAKEKGIYEKYGLDVNILQGGYSQNVIESLKNGTIDFGIMGLYSGVIERAKGTQIVNIAQIFQNSSILFVAKKKTGIKSLKDFNGKKIGVWRTVFNELTTGFLKKHKINAEVIEFDKGINPFLKDAVDISVMMNYNEYKHMINSGINPDEVNVFKFSDYDMNFPEDGIYCMESTFQKDPELCKKFVNASIEGWNYALANPDETIKIINKYREMAFIPFNLSHSNWMLKSMNDMIYPSGKKVKEGVLLESDFNHLTGFLYDNKFIKDKPLFSNFYKGNR